MRLGDIKQRLVDHRDKIDKGLDAAGGLARKRFGPNPRIDQSIGKAKQFLDKQTADDRRPGQSGPPRRTGPDRTDGWSHPSDGENRRR